MKSSGCKMRRSVRHRAQPRERQVQRAHPARFGGPAGWNITPRSPRLASFNDRRLNLSRNHSNSCRRMKSDPVSGASNAATHPNVAGDLLQESGLRLDPRRESPRRWVS